MGVPPSGVRTTTQGIKSRRTGACIRKTRLFHKICSRKMWGQGRARELTYSSVSSSRPLEGNQFGSRRYALETTDHGPRKGGPNERCSSADGAIMQTTDKFGLRVDPKIVAKVLWRNEKPCARRAPTAISQSQSRHVIKLRSYVVLTSRAGKRPPGSPGRDRRDGRSIVASGDRILG